MSDGELTLVRGGTAKWQINMGFNTTGGTWEVLENTCPDAPITAVIDHAAGTHQISFDPELTKLWKVGRYKLRFRLKLPLNEAIVFDMRVKAADS